MFLLLATAYFSYLQQSFNCPALLPVVSDRLPTTSPVMSKEGNREANGFFNASSDGSDAQINGAGSGNGVSGYSKGTYEPVGIGPAGSDHVLEPVAIVGMAMRLPGGVHNAEDFWDLLINKRDGRCRVPSDRYNVNAFYGPGKPGHVNSQHGYFLDHLDLAHIDASFWSMSKQEAKLMDPQQRLLLGVVYECLENAGAKDWRGKNIGCYVGCFGEDWLDMDAKDTANSHMYRLTGYSEPFIANRISYEFDFKGPRYVHKSAVGQEGADSILEYDNSDSLFFLINRSS